MVYTKTAPSSAQPSVQLDSPSLQTPSTYRLSQDVSSVGPSDNSNGPLLPLSIPIQRNGHGAHPSSKQTSQRTAKDLVDRAIQRDHLSPLLTVRSMYVDEREDGEEGDVRGADECVREVGGERGAEEDLEDAQDRDGEDGEE